MKKVLLTIILMFNNYRKVCDYVIIKQGNATALFLLNIYVRRGEVE